MAYVPGYENDIFVSYAHVDNIPLSGISKGWVETFIDNLATKLAQKIGRTDLFKLWDDRLLAQNAPLTPEIVDALKSWFVPRNFLKKAKALPPLIETESFGCFLWMVNLLCGQRRHGSPAG